MVIYKNIGRLVTPLGNKPLKGKQAMNDLKVVLDAVVVCEHNIIKFVGTSNEFEQSPFFAKLASLQKDKIIDCDSKVMLPGFCDSHTHLVFGGYRDDEFIKRAAGVSYMEIMKAGGGIAKSVELTRAASEDELFKTANDRIDELLKLGITSLEIKSGYGLDKDTELKQLRVIKKLQEQNRVNIVATFMGAHSIPKEYKGKDGGGLEYIEYIVKEVLPLVKKQNLAQFVDIFCEKGVFSVEESQRLLSAAKAMGFGLKIHADEIVCLGGAELGVSLGAVSADHLLHVSDKGVLDLAGSDTIATMLPLTAFCLGEPFAPARKLIDSGAAVALATDFNPGSCFSYSVPLMIAIAVLKMGMSINEVISALTLNGACAMGLGGKVGTIEVGKKADLVLLKHNHENFLAYNTGCNVVGVVFN